MTKYPGADSIDAAQGFSYFLDPFGCVKNQVDAETMMALLNQSGWRPVPVPDEADLIIVNSCGFIESAKKESLNAVFSYRKAYPGKKILLAGCLAQRYGEELSMSLSEADHLFGVTDISRITEAASCAIGQSVKTPPANGQRVKPPVKGISDAGGFLGKRPILSLPGSAYVKISEGCDNRCSFCAIPNIRGPLKSRSIDSILEECKVLLSRGIRELCLIGQDIASYGLDWPGGESRLPELLSRLSGLDGQFWVRLLYIHPDHFPLPILDLFLNDSRFLPYFDIPFQHASAALLRAMNRHGSAAAYLSLIEKIRGVMPNAVIRSTFLVGFPGETGRDFEALLDFQERAGLDWLGVFAYSREEDTPSYSMRGRVSKKTAGERKRLIEEKQVAITEKRMDRFVGKTEEVLVEEEVDSGLYLGRLTCQAPEVDGAAVIATDKALKPGGFERGLVFERAGFDLRVRV